MNHKLQQVTNAPSKARCKKQFWLSISFGLLICLLVCFFTIPTLQGTGATVLKVGPCIPPPSGMVAWWPLDETSGTTAHDIAGYPNNGTWINNPTPVPGMVSGALSFNGNNSVEVVDHSELNFGKDDFSIDVWVKVKETGSSSVQTILDKRIASQPNQIGYELYLYGGKPGIQLADGTFTNYNSTTSIADGNWHFIAVTVERNNSSGLLFYVDGGLVSTFNPTAHAGNLTNAAPFVIARNLITSSQVFTGTLDEIELFKRVLSAVEIKSIYSAGSAGKCKGTAQIHVCKFNDSNGNGVQDTGELLIPNWPFNVTGPGGPYSASTGTNGCFDLIVPAPGTYTVTEIVDLTQWTPTTPNPQTVTVQPNTGVIFTFGNHRGPLTGQICVKKFNDVNGNGVQDTGEPLLSGWVFNVTDQNGNLVGTITTNPVSASSCLTVPAPGTYTVTEVVQPGWTVTTNNNPSTVTVQPGQTVPLTFGNHRGPLTGQICVCKFNDLNSNSVQDTGEGPLVGWVFNITGPNFSGTITTDAKGCGCLTVPAPGTYTVTEVVQSGWTVTTNNNPSTVIVQPGQQMSLTFGNRQQCTCLPPPEEGMVGWWPLDETSGPTSFDIAGYPNNGTWINNPTPASGKVAGALYFVGPYVEVPPQAELDFGTGDFSIDAWVRPVDCSHGVGGVLSPIVDKFNGTTGFSLYLDQPTVGVAYLKLNINGSTFMSSGTIPTLGSVTWSHIAVTIHRGTTVGTFYINGSQAGSFTPPTGTVTNNLPLWIGEIRVPGGRCEIAIDELELFNRVLSPDEIKGIHNADSCGKCKPVTAQICVTKFNDLDGNGKPDQNEPLLSGWVFNVTDQNGNLVGTITTNPVSASSCLTVPAPGTYTVTEVVQPGWTVTTPNPQTVTVQPGQTANLNFGNIEKGKCDLLIEKTVSPDPVASGGTVTITLTVKNVGTSACGPIPGIIVADPWLVGLTNPSSVVVNVVNNPAPSAGPWTTGFSGGEIWGTNPTPLPPGYEVTFTFTATVTASPGSMIQNCSEVSNVGDADQTNNHSCVTIQVTRYIKPTIIILQIGKSNFTVNGISNTLDSPPIIKNNRTLLPIRAIVEALGGSVSWDATERKVTVSLGSTTIELWIGKSIAKVNGIDTPIDSTNPKVVPEIINSRTMLPIRFIAETLGCDVQWDGTMKTITITYQP